MTVIKKDLIRHLLSAVISLPVLLVIWFYLNPVITKLLSGEYPDVIVLPESVPFNCCCTLIYIIFLFAPISSYAEKFLIERYSIAAWIHAPIVLLLIIITTFVLFLMSSLILDPNWDAVAFVALENALWGGSYWIVFRISGRAFSKANNSFGGGGKSQDDDSA